MQSLSYEILYRSANRALISDHCIRNGGFSRRLYASLASRTYDDAVDLLNKLQTPYKVLKKRWDAGIRLDKTANEEMRKCLNQIGYSQRDLDKLNITHVAGTKGKGSTCAYVDSILSQHRKSHDIPRNVGLFTSPHLIAIRERIRINSVPISRDLFAKYFFEVWDKLEAAEVPFVKPVYFRYLTLMSYHVFLKEGVDAAIYEVGVGGEYDSTNITDHPAVTGISHLGIDHTFALGATIQEIAWHKAGIQKKEVPSFTVNQVPSAMEVIEKRAMEREVSSLTVVDQDPRLGGVKIRPDAPFQRSNASLAIALAETVLTKLDPGFERMRSSLPKEFVEGLEKVVWRGRCETKEEGKIKWYLDGAHTQESIIVAAKWFGEESSEKPGARVLIFNQQGHRQAIELLEGLHKAIEAQGSVQFDHVIFCPAVPTDQLGKRGIRTTQTPARSLASLDTDSINLSTDAAALAGLEMQKKFAERWRELDPSSSKHISVLSSVEDAVEYVRRLEVKQQDGIRVHAFITGSVHLVGRALGILEGVDAL